MQSLAIVGVGLIGGSFGLALRKAGFEGPIWGISSDRSIEAAVRRGAITKGITLEEAAAEADVLYLAQPIAQILSTIEVLSTIRVREGCLVTDAGSTKAQVVQAADRFLPDTQFLGGHPMAGKEQRGVEHADADLFTDRAYVLTPGAAAAPGREPNISFRTWLGAIGARVVEMSAAEHDLTVAYTSHLPQLLSTALAVTLAQRTNIDVRQIFGSGLLDMTRLALSTPEIWTSILETNKPAVQAALRSFEALLTEVQTKLEENGTEELFRIGSRLASELRKAPRS